MAMRDNFRIPLIGYLIRALGAVPLPEHPSGMPAYFRTAKACLEKGEWIVCFAEGILYPYCTRLRAFHPGGFLMASMAQVPVVPIAITFRPRRGLFRLLGRKPLMELHILPPSHPPQQRRGYMQWKERVIGPAADLSNPAAAFRKPYRPRVDRTPCFLLLPARANVILRPGSGRLQACFHSNVRVKISLCSTRLSIVSKPRRLSNSIT